MRPSRLEVRPERQDVPAWEEKLEESALMERLAASAEEEVERRAAH